MKPPRLSFLPTRWNRKRRRDSGFHWLNEYACRAYRCSLHGLTTLSWHGGVDILSRECNARGKQGAPTTSPCASGHVLRRLCVRAERQDDADVLSLTRPVVNTPHLALQSLSPPPRLLVWPTPGEEASFVLKFPQILPRRS